LDVIEFDRALRIFNNHRIFNLFYLFFFIQQFKHAFGRGNCRLDDVCDIASIVMGWLNDEEYWIECLHITDGYGALVAITPPTTATNTYPMFPTKPHEGHEYSGNKLRLPTGIIEIIIELLNWAIALCSCPNALTILCPAYISSHDV